jgi:Uma2 family endonuclease
MALSKQKLYTVEEFEDFVERPENETRLFEMINGEIVEKVPSNPSASEIAQLIAFFIRLFLRQRNIAGYVTGEQGGYVVNGQRYAPDVAYISKARQPELARKGYNPLPPELAVEVESSSTAVTERRLRAKLYHYLAAGTWVWVVYPDTREVEIHAPGQAPLTLTESDTIDGGEVLPEFKLAVKDIFAETG